MLKDDTTKRESKAPMEHPGESISIDGTRGGGRCGFIKLG